MLRSIFGRFRFTKTHKQFFRLRWKTFRKFKIPISCSPLVSAFRPTTIAALGMLTVGYHIQSSDQVKMESDIELVSMDEVAKHCTEDDAWIVINGQVFDVTNFLDQHPGGRHILVSFLGKDASRGFNSVYHSKERAKLLFPGLHVANVKDYVPLAPMDYTKPKPIKEPGKKNVLIIGAGIVGSAAAYFLSQNGHSVNVIDKSAIVGGTALKSSAILFLGRHLESKDKQKKSVTEWSGEVAYTFMKMIQDTWQDIGFLQKATIGVIQTDEEMKYVQKLYGPGGKLEKNGIIIPPEKIHEIEPLLSPDLKGVTYHQNGCTVDPYLLCNALADRAKKQGSRFYHELEVVDLERTPNGGFNVICKTPMGTQESFWGDNVLICTGWQARNIAKMAGYEKLVPVYGMHGQMIAMANTGLKLRHNMFAFEGPTAWKKAKDRRRCTIDANDLHQRYTRHFYAVQIGNGVIKIGGDRVEKDMDSVPFKEGLLNTAKHVGEIIPALKNLSFEGAWGGTMPFTPDQRNIIGQLEEGLFVATGSGFMRGAVVGQLLAECVEGNKEHEVYLEQCDPHRFQT